MRNKVSDYSDVCSCLQKKEWSTPIANLCFIALAFTAMSCFHMYILASGVDRLYNKQLNAAQMPKEAGGVDQLYIKQVNTSQMPKDDMKAFIQREKAYDINVTDVTGLPADLFKKYSVASCLEGNSIEKLRENLHIQLDGVPENVRDRLVNRALMEGISQKSSITDSDSRVGKDGQATMFMGYWSTTYNGDELVLIRG